MGQEADPGSKFVEWNVPKGIGFVGCGGAESAECIALIPPGTEIVIEAVFEKLPIHIALEGTGSGRVTGREKVGVEEGGVPPIACSNIAGELEEPCDTSPSLIAGFFEGITVEQEAGPDSEFVEWAWEGEGFEGDCPPEGGSVIVGACTVFLNEPGAEITIKAIFDLKTQPLTLTTSGGGSGSFECEDLTAASAAAPCVSGDEFPENHEVKVIPVAGEGSEFTAFSGDCTSSPCEVEMTGPKSVNANFELENRTLTVAVEGEGELTGTGITCDEEAKNGGPECEAELPYGTLVSLAVTAAGENVIGSLEGTESAAGGACEFETTTGSCEFSLTEDSGVNAVFVAGNTIATKTANVHGEVPQTTTLESKCGNVNLGKFKPNLQHDETYAKTCELIVTATGEENRLTATDEGVDTGHLTQKENETPHPYSLPQPLEVQAEGEPGLEHPGHGGGTLQSMVGSPVTLLNYLGPVNSDHVTLEFSQLIKEHDALHTGEYSKTITLTLKQIKL